jgi:hypothetical protein
MSTAKEVTFKKRIVAGECRARRCTKKAELEEFERIDGKTVLLCPSHFERATAHKADHVPPPVVDDKPVPRTGVDAASGNPIYSLDGGATWVFGELPDDAPLVAAEVVDPHNEALAEANERALEDLHTHAAAAVAPPPAVEQTSVVITHAEAIALASPLHAEYTALAPQLVGFAIDNQDSLDIAGELLQKIKGQVKTLEAKRKAITSPLLEAKRAIDALFKPAKDAAGRVEALLKGSMSKFVDAQTAARTAALQAGNHTEALAVVQPTMPAGVSTRTLWRFEVTDPALVPRDYLVVDSARVQAHVNEHKSAASIPGIRAFPETGISSGSKS